MKIRNAKAHWNGTLKDGNGTMDFSNYSGPFTFASRFEDGKGTNPEELIGAAHSGCYSMFLSALIGKAGFNPESIETSAAVTVGDLDGGPAITHIELVSRVKCADLTEEKFNELALAAKAGCPVSRLYEGSTAKIDLDAKLVG